MTKRNEKEVLADIETTATEVRRRKTTEKDQLATMFIFLTVGTIDLLNDIAKTSNQSAEQVARGLIEQSLLPFMEDS